MSAKFLFKITLILNTRIFDFSLITVLPKLLWSYRPRDAKTFVFFNPSYVLDYVLLVQSYSVILQFALLKSHQTPGFGVLLSEAEWYIHTRRIEYFGFVNSSSVT